jgi:hypothetical protein
MLSTAKMTLQSDLKDAFEKAAYDAYMEQYQKNKVPEAKSDSDVKKGFEDLADKFSKKFASSVSKDMATAIHDFVKEIAIQVNTIPPSVMSLSGPCTGMIPMTSFSVM